MLYQAFLSAERKAALESCKTLIFSLKGVYDSGNTDERQGVMGNTAVAGTPGDASKFHLLGLDEEDKENVCA